MKNIICLILPSLFILLPGCTHNIVYLEVMDDSSLVDIIEKGDVQKYNWLSLHSLYSGWEDEESRCAAYSFIIAECYGYEPAYGKMVDYLSNDSNYIEKKNGLELLERYRKLQSEASKNKK